MSNVKFPQRARTVLRTRPAAGASSAAISAVSARGIKGGGFVLRVPNEIGNKSYNIGRWRSGEEAGEGESRVFYPLPSFI